MSLRDDLRNQRAIDKANRKQAMADARAKRDADHQARIARIAQRYRDRLTAIAQQQ